MKYLLAFLLSCVPVFGSTTYGISDPAIAAGMTPGNWYVNGSTSILTINIGAGVTFNFTGTSLVANVNTGTGSPTIGWTIDGGAMSTANLNPSSSAVTLATGLADTTHTVVLTLIYNPFAVDGSNWTAARNFSLLSVTVDTGKVLSTATLPANGAMLFFGNSLTAGEAVLAQGTTNTWAKLVAANYDASCGTIGFNGQGYETGTPYEPVAIDSFPYIYSGQARSFSAPVPRCITIEYGYNGATSAADVTAYLTAMRAAVGPTPYIKQLVPFSRVAESVITTGVSDYLLANPGDTKTSLIPGGIAMKAIVDNPAYTVDGTHLNAAGSAAMAPLLIPYYADAMGGVNATTANITTMHVGQNEVPANVIEHDFRPDMAKREEDEEMAAA